MSHLENYLDRLLEEGRLDSGGRHFQLDLLQLAAKMAAYQAEELFHAPTLERFALEIAERVSPKSAWHGVTEQHWPLPFPPTRDGFGCSP